jgi:putative flippase GtrA
MEPADPESLFVRLSRAYCSRQFLTFVLFGGSAAVINLASGRMLYSPDFGVLPYWAAVTIAAMSGLLVNFSLNYFFNFTYRDRSAMGQLGTFCVVAFVGIGLTAALAVAFRQILDLSDRSTAMLSGLGISSNFMAHFLAVGMVTFYSYAAHRYFTFNVGIRRRAGSLLSKSGEPLLIRARGCKQ